MGSSVANSVAEWQGRGEVGEEQWGVLPTNEIDTLTMTVTDAIDLAAEGHLADGYAALLAGLKRAEEIAAEGVEWGPELVEWWKGACQNYCDSYGVPLE
jgi:hypothetical protein